MSVGSAWRRFGATTNSDAQSVEARPWPALIRAASFAGLWKGFQAIMILGAIVLGNIAIVAILDALLDRLHD